MAQYVKDNFNSIKVQLKRVCRQVLQYLSNFNSIKVQLKLQVAEAVTTPAS